MKGTFGDTAITLLLIYLNNLQKDRKEEDKVKGISDLIFSEKYSKKSFNLQVDDRIECMNALYEGKSYDYNGKGESVRNLVERYGDIEELFDDKLRGDTLPYFIDWLMDNVVFVEITTYSDDDAYTIFETMNDRGKNLTPTDMLKGYLISNVESQDEKFKLNELWKNRIFELKKFDDEEDLEFFKAWLRARYADTIRQTKKGAENEDFEKIATRFHSWVRDNKIKIGLNTKDDFHNFIKRDFDFYVKLYLKIYVAAIELQKGLETIYYIEERGFTLYFPILMAPIKITDDESTINKKLALVSRFLEMFIIFRPVNYRTLSYSSIRYSMFTLVKKIRDKSVPELVQILKNEVSNFDEGLNGMEDLILRVQNKRFIHFMLARITRHIEEKCGMSSSFKDYMNPNLKKPFEIEHIWGDKFEEHEEFKQENEFDEYRNTIGALILVPRGFNQSYQDDSYEKKLPHYYGQNLLAKTLSPQCYQNNPTFLTYVKESGLPFKAKEHFKKQDVIERTRLYQKICEEIWNLKVFDEIASG